MSVLLLLSSFLPLTTTPLLSPTVTPPHQFAPAHCHHSSVHLESTSPSSAGNPCTCFFGGCARRCSPRRIPCTGFFCGCARRCPTHRNPCNCFFGGCARRCLTQQALCRGVLRLLFPRRAGMIQPIPKPISEQTRAKNH